MSDGWDRISFPDGVIEFRASGAVTGPDQVGGQHFGTTYLYARRDGGPWRRVASRSRAAAIRRAAGGQTAEEAMAAICEPEEAR